MRVASFFLSSTKFDVFRAYNREKALWLGNKYFSGLWLWVSICLATFTGSTFALALPKSKLMLYTFRELVFIPAGYLKILSISLACLNNEFRLFSLLTLLVFLNVCQLTIVRFTNSLLSPALCLLGALCQIMTDINSVWKTQPLSLISTGELQHGGRPMQRDLTQNTPRSPS